MKNITVILVLFIFISCKNEDKKPNGSSDVMGTEKQIPAAIKTIKTTVTPLKIIEPVKWVTDTRKLSKTEYELIIVANIEDKYHLYSQTVLNNGPEPTVFIFEKSDHYTLIGNTSEEKGHTVYDSIFKLDIKSFSTQTTFKQKIKITNTTTFKINAEIEFMSCNNTTCLMGYSAIKFQI
ncbi:cytochrome C biogenesis protein [Bizionia saleffrena]|uniref:Cytochrome C biogenesis protein n=1 Tax=Bizionia saleffrena TaxID=291189 RepID=A0A8H2LC75_9FLAO|nr:protein-disulfide reductase DsbD domain-containing protein [Bizionia saleffrena]TYB72599.1 cytochrome C biogenesis protein [Bizionia saleffrena]